MTGPRDPSESLQPMPVPSWLDQVCEALAEPTSDRSGLPYTAAEVPFVAAHHWHAGAVAELIGEATGRRGVDTAPHDAVRAAHARAAAGEPIGAHVWSAVLEPALADVYRLAYPREQVHSRASSAAASFARSRGWSEDEAEHYGETCARLNTEVSERVHAEANALANAAACSAAFASHDADDYARVWPFAMVRAWIAAYSGPADADGSAAQQARTRLRDGLVDAVGRARVSR